MGARVGYDAPMSDATTPETKTGPANPRPEGAEAATPPGGPLRQDGPPREVPGGHHDDASASRAANRSAEEAGGGTIPVDEEQPDPRPPGRDEAQEENAESSLDQPSEG